MSIFTSIQRKTNMPRPLAIAYEICRMLVNIFCATFFIFLYVNLASTFLLVSMDNMVYGVLDIGFLFTSFWVMFRASSIDYMGMFEYFRDSFLDILKEERESSMESFRRSLPKQKRSHNKSCIGKT